jgi:hypothetical protein
MGQSLFFRANSDWETDKWMTDIPYRVTAAEVQRLENKEIEETAHGS